MQAIRDLLNMKNTILEFPQLGNNSTLFVDCEKKIRLSVAISVLVKTLDMEDIC